MSIKDERERERERENKKTKKTDEARWYDPVAVGFPLCRKCPNNAIWAKFPVTKRFR